MAPTSFKRIILAERPTGDIVPDVTFKQLDAPFDESMRPGAHAALVKVQHISIDPAMRAWLNDKRSYIEPVKLGDVMRAAGLATVVAVGPSSKFHVGDVVYGVVGWQEYAVLDDKELRLITPPKGANPLDFLGVLGPVGLTAYFGLLDVGKIKAGETLVVSGAAGATGSVVCQIGKKKGARVIAIAGGSEKCKWLKESIGVDEALDYKSPSFYKDFKKLGYLDVFFDNVGGQMLEFMLTRLNKDARIVLCGSISTYNDSKSYGLKTYQNLISQRGTMQGFIYFDYASQFGRALDEMAGWLAEGSLQRKFHIVDGLQNAPSALTMLYNGGNTGKLLVKISDPVLPTSKL